MYRTTTIRRRTCGGRTASRTWWLRVAGVAGQLRTNRVHFSRSAFLVHARIGVLRDGRPGRCALTRDIIYVRQDRNCPRILCRACPETHVPAGCIHAKHNVPGRGLKRFLVSAVISAINPPQVSTTETGALLRFSRFSSSFLRSYFRICSLIRRSEIVSINFVWARLKSKNFQDSPIY